MVVMNQIVSYDLDFLIPSLRWSPEIYTFYGYGQNEPANNIEWWAAHIHPEDAMLLNQTMDKLDDPHVKEWTVEYRFRKADNSYVLVVDHTNVLRDEQGRAVRLIGTLSPRLSDN